MTKSVARLRSVGDHCYAWVHSLATWGYSNAGVVVDASGRQGLLVDTQFTLGWTRQLCDAISATLPDLTIGDVVNTHANGDHTHGNMMFADARVWSSKQTAADVAAEVSPETLRQVFTSSLPEPLAGYAHRFFGQFDFSDIQTVPPTDTFSGQHTLRVGDTAVELLELGPAHTHGDVAVLVADDGVLFTGDLLFVGDHPVTWSGPLDGWIAACERMLATGATTIVPGHGPVVGPDVLREFMHYLEHVAEHALAACRAGTPYTDAARTLPIPGYAQQWGNPERLVFLVAAVYRSVGAPAPLAQLDLLADAAQIAASLGR